MALCGYNEIQNPLKRYGLIDRPRLMRLLGIDEGISLSLAETTESKEKKSKKGGNVSGKQQFKEKGERKMKKFLVTMVFGLFTTDASAF